MRSTGTDPNITDIILSGVKRWRPYVQVFVKHRAKWEKSDPTTCFHS